MTAAGPGYWMHETTGVLRPAVEAYLAGGPMTDAEVVAMRAYLRQWIFAPVYDPNRNPYPLSLADLRADIEYLTTRHAIEVWLDDAGDLGIDPL